MNVTTIGGSSVVKSFQDSFTRANASSIGPNWLIAPAYANSVALTTQVSVNANNLNFSDTSVNQVQSFPILVIPMIGAPNLNGKTHFSQATFVSGNDSIGTRGMQCGCVVGAGNSSTATFDGVGCYALITATDPTQQFIVLIKWNANVAGSTLFTSAVSSLTANSVMRLGYNPGVSSVVLTVSLNGTLLTTITDNTSPLLSGMPGMVRWNWVSNASPGTGSTRFKNYSCGPGI